MFSRRKLFMAGGAMAAVSAAAVVRSKNRAGVQLEPASDTTKKRPNILLIMTDQERSWTTLPKELVLPAHEKLRENATSYNNYTIHTTPCSPTRSTFYFGQHTQNTGMVVNHGAPPFPEMRSGMPSLGHYLRAQGYYTAYKGKWHLSHMAGDHQLNYGPFPNTEDALEPFGFSDFNIDGDPHGATLTGYRFDGQIASDSVHWMEKKGKAINEAGKPWFMAVNFVNPHDIMYYSYGDEQVRSRKNPNLLAPIAPPPVGGMYDKIWDLPMPESFYKHDKAKRNWSHASYADFCDMIYGKMDTNNEAIFRQYQGYYFNCLRDVDTHLGTVLTHLKRLKFDENTIVVYCSDHGEMAGAHKLRQKGPHAYRENINCPMIIRHPDVKTGRNTDALISPVDVIPTLLKFAGVDKPSVYEGLKGIDVAATVASEVKTERDKQGILINYGVAHYWDPNFVEKAIEKNSVADKLFLVRQVINNGMYFPSLQNRGLFRGVYDGEFKFARYFKPAEHHLPTSYNMLVKFNDLELYDVKNDPHELNNLALNPDAHKETLMRLSDKTNALIMREVGRDDGQEHTGPASWYKLAV
jgi:arylsulfatase A-like enzyme